jgi:hypothetical protein
MHEDEVGAHGRPLAEPVVIPTTYKCFVCEAAERLQAEIPAAERPGVTVKLMLNEAREA